MTFGSLFSGIGGLDLGLERAGMECRWQVEVDDYCQRVLTKHWPAVPKFKDVHGVGKQNLEPVELICGGFPCQPWSLAGKRGGVSDERHLWPEMLRVIGELQPRYVLGENVPGIAPYLDTVVDDLEAKGYQAVTFEIPAAAFDAPHIRYRIFVVAESSRLRCEIPVANKNCSNGEEREAFSTKGVCPHVADAKSLGGKQATDGCEPGQSESELGSEAVPDSNGQSPGWSTIARRECNQWSVEPAVGRVATRLSAELDGGGLDEKGNDQEAVSAELALIWATVRQMWLAGEFTTTPSKLRLGRFRGVMSGMPYPNSLGSWHMGQRLQEDKDLRNLWERVSSASFQESQYLLPELLERIGQAQRDEAMELWKEEPSIPRVAHGVKNRVDRLKGLGNAVVPQVAEWIGERIMAAHAP